MSADALSRDPRMTLRLRLVLALVALVTAGLAVFGITTYVLYANSEYRRLDDRIQNSIPLVTGQLYDNAGIDHDGGPGGTGGGGPGDGGPGPAGDGRPRPPVLVPSGTYAELRDSKGAVVPGGVIEVSSSSSQPDLPSDIAVPDQGNRFFTTGSETGSGRWRVAVSPSGYHDGNAVIVAVPLGDVTSSLTRLVIIETAAAVVLLALLAAGSWLILRRGLHPLEQMAASARSITAGDLSQRVAPADQRTEVGQLGLALNTMLGEIEEAFQEREATERRLRQFLADASHELRTPLTSIQGFAELFRLDADQNRVELAVILRRIEEETARMKTLVNDLLLLARLDQTRPAQRQPVDLAVLAADACSDAVAAEPDRGVTLDAPQPVVVSGDRDHLRQAIANLVTNALRHTPAGTPIEVSAHLRQGEAVLVVRDHGPGLDGEAMNHAFDRFWQADHARVGPGAGLGLSIVAAIAHEHGGTATAENARGGGAVFTLDLPLNGTPSASVTRAR
jgi:two-component system OmpR family sensor kinase